jgi:hypothetical protein
MAKNIFLLLLVVILTNCNEGLRDVCEYIPDGFNMFIHDCKKEYKSDAHRKYSEANFWNFCNFYNTLKAAQKDSKTTFGPHCGIDIDLQTIVSTSFTIQEDLPPLPTFRPETHPNKTPLPPSPQQ